MFDVEKDPSSNTAFTATQYCESVIKSEIVKLSVFLSTCTFQTEELPFTETSILYSFTGFGKSEYLFHFTDISFVARINFRTAKHSS